MTPQYAKSSNPDVVAAVQSRYEAHRFLDKAGEKFARKYSPGSKPSFRQGMRSSYLCALDGPRPVGPWKPTYSGWSPRLFSPAFYEMLAVRARLVDIPGMSRSFEGPTREGGAVVRMWPKVFILDGVAWFSLPEEPAQPGKHTGELDPTIWTPVTYEQWAVARG